MKKLKVRIEKSEYVILEICHNPNHYSEKVLISKEDYEFVEKAMKDFRKAQKILQTRIEKGE